MSTYPPIVLREAGVYTHKGAYIWWRVANINLDGARPVDLWWDDNPGNRDAVRDELSRLMDGNG
jgi:hypothetical protein